jgi:DNA-binding transcriptional MocR family regulator
VVQLRLQFSSATSAHSLPSQRDFWERWQLMTRDVMLAYRVLTKLGLTEGRCQSLVAMSININFWVKLQTSGIPAPALLILLVYVNFWLGWFLMLRIPSDGGARTNRTRDTLFLQSIQQVTQSLQHLEEVPPREVQGLQLVEEVPQLEEVPHWRLQRTQHVEEVHPQLHQV